MPYGLEVKNSNGDIVVDSEYSNFMLLFSRSVSITFRPDNYNGDAQAYEAKVYYFPYTVTSYAPPVLAIRVTSNRLATGSWVGGPGNWRGIYMVTDTAGLSGNKTCSMEIRAYVASGHGQLSPSGQYGFQVFDASGNKTFDSRLKPLIVDSRPIINFTGDPWNRVGSVRLQASASKGLDAACLGWINGYARGSSGYLNHYYYKAFRDSGGNVTIRKVMQAYEDDFIPPPIGLEVLGTNIADKAQALVVNFQ